MFGLDNFWSWPMSADDYRLLAIIAIIVIIAINRNYCQNVKVIASILVIILVITSHLSGNYCIYLAFIAIIWRLWQLPRLAQLSSLVGRARSCWPYKKHVIVVIVCHQWSYWGPYETHPFLTPPPSLPHQSFKFMFFGKPSLLRKPKYLTGAFYCSNRS